MQVSATAIRVSYAKLTGLRTFFRRSKQVSAESPRAVASRSWQTSSQSIGAAATDEERGNKGPSIMVDGRLNYRVRKKRQSAVVSEKEEASAAESHAADPVPGNEDDLPSVPRLVAKESPPVVAIAAVASVMSSSARRQSARVLKRVAEAEERKLEMKTGLGDAELTVNRSKRVQRASKKNAAAVVQQAAEMDLPSPPSAATATTDFWHSSLSDGSAAKSGAAAVVNNFVAGSSTMSPIIPIKTLFAPEELAKALEHLKSVDPLLKTVIEMHDAPKFEKCESAFTALCRSIVFQQLATKAASVIFGRLVTLCEGLDNLTPTVISQLSAEQLRAIGISGRKASYLHDLAANFLSGALSDSSVNEMDDESLMKALIAVKGIGMWSVHMFMLFSLHKPDVLPVTDLGVRKGFQKLYKLKELPSPDQVEKIACSWQPYRSLGSWYMWRVLSNTPIVKVSD